ncbi:P-type conjugative transfer protein TrbL [Azospirillum thermophilum]|uniref:P-type conjugative transfer protein TrbL n=1 Tax=Azospirillum thermophilum TaxID=2202148 RepID=A0A2S2CVV0_9PROT|nr:P-type conjugative transfer protein TrbL [Azospirillum thermophilum]AWK88609.1 P-type conjugative transfer protein TrbL [Azospirillum thermophilum]
MKRGLKWSRWVPLILAAAIVMVSYDAAAQAANNSLDNIVRLYRDHSTAWQAALRNYAITLFWLLAGIEFTWAAVRLALKGADFGEWVAEVINQVLFIGFFLTLLLHSADYAQAVVDSFREAANQASIAGGGTGRISPSNIFEVGVNLALRVVGQVSLSKLAESAGFLIAALVVLICFALIAAFLILALVESYIVISAGVLLMGFGGSRWTKDYAVKVMVYAVAVGAKLFVLQLLIGLGQAMILSWEAQIVTNTSDVFVIVGSAVVMLAVTKVVPDMVQSLINGTSPSGGGALVGATAAVGGAAVGALAGAAGAGMAVGGASKLASAQLASSGLSSSPPPAFAARMAARAAGNLGQAAVQDLGRRLSGRSYGTMGGRMGESMLHKARELRAAAEKPQPPQAPQAPQQGQPPGQPDNVIRPE